MKLSKNEYICWNCGQISSSSNACSKCSSQMEIREEPKDGDFLIPLKKRGQKRMFRGYGVP